MRKTMIMGLLLMAVVLVGCSSDNNEPNNGNQTLQGMTEFAVGDKSSRTAGKYSVSTSAVDFFWTSGDKLWLNNGGTLVKSTSDNISGTALAPTAKFYFSGDYSARNSYSVRYTGANSTSGDKVTIKSSQTQPTPNVASHIGTCGDCGTATATRGTDGVYHFMLDHKASYLTFVPFYRCVFDASVKIQSIKVKADQCVAGTYNFDDTGLLTNTITSGSKCITLTLSGGFPIPTSADPSKNAAIMVIAPGTYTNFMVEYTLKDCKTGVTGTVKKTYPSVKFTAGKNTKIAYDLAITRFDGKYYMWDARQHYWQGFESSQPYLDGVSNNNIPTVGSARWHNTTDGFVTASNTAAQARNINEISWYIWHGDPRWDGELLWSMHGHLYKGGMWFKKSSQIPGFCKNKYSDGKDYRRYFTGWAEGNSLWLKAPVQERPANTSGYFFLPAMGYFDNGKLLLREPGYSGAYWSSDGLVLTGTAGTRQVGISLHFSNTTVGVELDLRSWGYPIASSTLLL